MKLFTILKKRIVGNKEKLDLHQKTLDINGVKGGIVAPREIIVQEGFDGRLDLICKEFYGVSEIMDYVLKANGISDPFSIQQGDKLILPNLNSIGFVPSEDREKLNRVPKPNGEVSLKERLNKVEREIRQQSDERRVEFLKRKRLLKEQLTKEFRGLPPNFIKRPPRNS